MHLFIRVSSQARDIVALFTRRSSGACRRVSDVVSLRIVLRFVVPSEMTVCSLRRVCLLCPQVGQHKRATTQRPLVPLVIFVDEARDRVCIRLAAHLLTRTCVDAARVQYRTIAHVDTL